MAERTDQASASKLIRQELRDFAAVRGIQNYRVRLRTVTASIDATLRDAQNPEEKLAMEKKLTEQAVGVGALRHLVSVYLNVLLDSIDSPSSQALVFDRTFLQNISVIVSGGTLRRQNKKKPRLLNMEQNRDVELHLLAYVQEHLPHLSLETQRLLKSVIRRCSGAAIDAIWLHNKRYVRETFVSRMNKHLVCALEKRLLELLGDDTSPDRVLFDGKSVHHFVNLGATCLYAASLHETENGALNKITLFCNRSRGSGGETLAQWLPAMLSLLNTYREVLSPVRNTSISNCPSLLSVLRKVRGLDAELNVQKKELVRQRDEWQPVLKMEKGADCTYDKAAIVAQRHLLRNVAVPEWFDSDEQVTASQVEALEAEIYFSRRLFWDTHQLPGMDSVPSPFSLLPLFKLQPAFVTYDNESIRTLTTGTEYRNYRLDKSSKFWFTAVFDLHSRGRVAVRSEPRHPRQRKKKGKRGRRRRKVLKRGLQRKGIPQCMATPWVADPLHYERQKFNSQVPVPWLVNSITTDGLQVKVLLATVIKADNAGGPTVSSPLPPGISGLVDKGYGSIVGTLESAAQSRGLFRHSAPVLRNTSTKMHVIAVDPGQVKVATTARAVFDPEKSHDENAAMFTLPETTKSGNFFSGKRYRFESLALHNQKVEKSRVVGAYKDALGQLSQVSLKIQGRSQEYAQAVYSTLDVMMAELMSAARRRRRFARFRAVKRTLRHMAVSIAYGAEEERLRNKRGKKKRMLRKELYAQPRVVCFEQAQFGHGRRGPIPRKALLRELALLCPVVLVDEFRTSKCCHSCGSFLTSNSRSRVFRCTNNQAGAGGCSVTSIDRDTNAAANVGTCGMHMLLGMARPAHLTDDRARRLNNPN